VEHKSARVEHRSARVEHRSARVEHRSARVEHRSARVEHRSARVEHRSARVEHRSARVEHLSCVLHVVCLGGFGFPSMLLCYLQVAVTLPRQNCSRNRCIFYLNIFVRESNG
jgi:hypothetical protein